MPPDPAIPQPPESLSTSPSLLNHSSAPPAKSNGRIGRRQERQAASGSEEVSNGEMWTRGAGDG